MSAIGATHKIYRFGEFTLDVERGVLLKAGVERRLRPKTFEVLRLLIEHHGKLVSKNQLLETVWSPAIVTEDSVTQCLTEIRRALEDHDQFLIRTFPRRGYLFDTPVSGPDEVPAIDETGQQHAVAQMRTRAHYSIYFAALVFLLLVIWASAVYRHGRASVTVHRPTTPAATVSIAVLPLEDMSPGHDQAYLADGISEEIIDRLVHIPGLRVIARTSSFSFRGHEADIGKIASQLNVTNVLEGSVRKSGDRIRITTQLIRASDSSHLWSQTYNRNLGDALAVEDDVATAVAQALKLGLTKYTTRGSSEIIHPQAYEHVLLGKFFFNRRNTGDMERALKQFQLALRDDPNDVHAWVGIAGVHRVRFYEQGRNQHAELAAMKRAVDRALKLDSQLAEVQARASNYYAAKGQIHKALEHYEKAKALNPNAPLVLSNDAFVAVWQGHYDKAAAIWQRIVEQDPLGATSIVVFADHLVIAGRYEEAEKEYQKAITLVPLERAQIDAKMCFALILQGRPSDAISKVENLPNSADRDEILAMTGRLSGHALQSTVAIRRLSASPSAENAIRLAEVYAYLGQNDKAYDWLQRVLDLANSESAPDTYKIVWLQQAHASPFLRPLRSDPRWEKWATGFGVNKAKVLLFASTSSNVANISQ